MGILGVGMAKTSLKYEQPSRASQVMVLGFSVAVAFMAGWLVLTIMLGNSGTTMVATADDEVPAMATKQPPRVESSRVAASPPIVAPRQLLSPQADPGSLPGAAPAAAAPAAAPAAAAKITPPAAPAAAAKITPPAAPAASSGAALASLPPAPAVSAPATVPAAQSPMAAGSINDRVAVGDIYAQVTNKIGDEPADAPEVVPLPPHRPRTASVPFPRPRPQMEAQVQAQPEPRSLFDIITGGR
jgi:hypothetical protein